MEPAAIITWICVGVFAITALLTILHVSGIKKLPNPQHGEVLFKALIVEVVLISIAAFATINKNEVYADNASIADLSLKITEDEVDPFDVAKDLLELSKSTINEPCLRIKSHGLVLGKQYDVNWEYLDEFGNTLKSYKKTYTADENPESVYSCRKYFMNVPVGAYQFKVHVGGIDKTKLIRIVE